MKGRYQQRRFHGPDPRVRFDVILTVHTKDGEWSVRPRSKNDVQVKLACIGGASRFDFGSMKISIDETIEYYDTRVHISKKCANCGRPCVLKVNNWFPEGTDIEANIPTVIGEFEVSGFHLEDGLGMLEFVDELIIESGMHTVSVPRDKIVSGDVTSIEFPDGEKGFLKGISVKFSRHH